MQNYNQISINYINTTLDDYYIKPYFIESNFIKTNFQNIHLDDILIFKLIANTEYDKLKELIQCKKGIKQNLNVQDIDGDTPLHIAIFMCDYKITKLLIENNVNVRIKDKYGQTALHRTCFNFDCADNIKILNLFESIDDDNNGIFNDVDNFGNTAFHLTLKCMIKNKSQLTVQQFDIINKFKKLTNCKLLNNENQTVDDLLKILYKINDLF